MKTFSLHLIALIFISLNASLNAQWTPGGINYSGGNVGINSPTPLEKLQITTGKILIKSNLSTNNTVHTSGFRFTTDADANAAEILIVRGASASQTGLQFNTYNAAAIQTMTLLNGNVGIGTNTPLYKLHIEGTANGTDRSFINLKNNSITTASLVGITLISGASGNNGSIYYTSNAYAVLPGFQDCLYLYSGGTGGARLSANKGPMVFYTNVDGSNYPLPRMIIDIYGNIGIGTTTPDTKLTVNGNIKAKRIDVVSVIASDFVFDQNYTLRNLSEVESFVYENKHLPEIPSADELKKTGYDLGKMDDLLLRKIEELTLYVIEQNKKIIELEKKNETLEESIKCLK